MRKRIWMSLLGISWIAVGHSGLAQVQDQRGLGLQPVDENNREEVRETYRQAAQELGAYMQDFKTFYDELKQAVKEEGIAEFSDEPAGFGSVDIEETAKGLVVKMDLPGMDKNKIDVTLQDNQTLRVIAVREDSDESDRAYRQERYQGEFSKLIKLPQPVLKDDIQAKYEQGVLRIGLVIDRARKEEGVKVKIE